MCANCANSNKAVTFGCLIDMGVAYKPYKTHGYLFFGSYFECYSPISRFANWNILPIPSRFIELCKMNIQNFCLFLFFVRGVILAVMQICFKTSVTCCILTHIFFLLNTENNADLYIVILQSLSSTSKCDNEPQPTLFLWFGPILFLLHQSYVLHHS